MYQFSGIFASGITPIVATALWKMSGAKWWTICAYVLFSALVSAYSAHAIDRGRRRGGHLPSGDKHAVSAS